MSSAVSAEALTKDFPVGLWRRRPHRALDSLSMEIPFGAVFGLPIISQPQVAILGVGSIDKRVVVVDDMIAVRPMCYLTLGYDHRLIDGADAGRFLQALKDRLQDFDEKDV